MDFKQAEHDPDGFSFRKGDFKFFFLLDKQAGRTLEK